MNVTLTLAPAKPDARRFTEEQARKLVFFTEDGWIDSDKPQIIKLGTDGSITIALVRSEIYLGKEAPRELVGLVQCRESWLVNEKLTSMSVTPELAR